MSRPEPETDRKRRYRRHEQGIRQWRIVRALANGRLTDPYTIIDTEDVDSKTIRRDLETLMNAGFPIYITEIMVDGTPSLRVYMEKDWVTKCPGPSPDLRPRIRKTLDIDDVTHTLSNVRPELAVKRTPSEPVKPTEPKSVDPVSVEMRNGKMKRYYMCACGHAIRVNEYDKAESYNPTCRSCAAWVRGIRTGNIV